jgi:hypothetical protein
VEPEFLDEGKSAQRYLGKRFFLRSFNETAETFVKLWKPLLNRFGLFPFKGNPLQKQIFS